MASVGPNSAATTVIPRTETARRRVFHQSLPDRAVAWARESPATLWVGLIVAGSTLAHFLFALAVPAPWIIPDELIYSELAKSFAATAHFEVRGLPFSAWSFGPLYPMLISPAYRLAGSLPAAYVLVKLINAGTISTAAIPAYLLAKRLVSRRSAIMAAALSVLVPSTIYATKVMTENVSYPIFLLTVLAMIRVLERPGVRRQSVVLVLLLVAVLTRAQMVALVPAFLMAAAIVALLDERDLRQAVRRAAASSGLAWSATILGMLLVGGLRLAGHGSGAAVLGGHTELVHRISLMAVPEWFINHLAEIDLYAGVIPLVGLILLLVHVLSGRESSREVRIFAITSGAIFLWLITLAAVYMSHRTPARVFDRYTFYAVPLMLIALLAWIQLGMPRPRRTTRVVVATACMLPLILPFNSLLDGTEWGTSSSAVGLVPWYLIKQLADLSGTGILFLATVLLVTGLFGLRVVRANAATSHLLVRTTLIYFVAVGLIAQIANMAVASNAADFGLGSSSAAWIDRAVPRGAQVSVIWTGVDRRGVNGWYAIWENEFFNRSVGPVYYLDEPVRYGLGQTKLHRAGEDLVRASGKTVRAEYVLTDGTLPIVGRRIASDRSTGMALYRVAGAIRLRK